MNAKDLVLNIAVNLNRISKFRSEGNEKRARQFMFDNEQYIKELNSLELNSKFQRTFEKFKQEMHDFSDPEDYLTWANILTHRVKLI